MTTDSNEFYNFQHRKYEYISSTIYSFAASSVCRLLYTSFLVPHGRGDPIICSVLYIGLYSISMNKINTHLDIIVLAILTYTVDIERLLLLYVYERSAI